MASGLADLRLALRMIRCRPLLSGAVVLPIGLAIAINTALFSVMDGLLFRPLPFRNPDELIAIEYRRTGAELPELMYLPSLAPERERLRAGLESCPLLRGTADAGPVSAFDPEARELGLQVTGIDSRFFRLLGLTPALGSDFSQDDQSSPALLTSRSTEPLPVIIDYGLWQGAFGGDPAILGVRDLAGRRVRIVGVMEPGVKFPGETNVWVPLRTGQSGPPAYARLAPGATVDQLAARFPRLEFKELADAIRPDGSRTLLVLFGAASLLLLVAWVQVAALVFASAIGRYRELGVRLALGAGRARLLRQFAVENALLGGIAFAFAWLAARPLTAFIVSTLPRELSLGQYLTPDARTFFFTCAASLIGLVLLTVLPASVIRRASPLRLLQGHVGSLPFSAERLRHILLAAQVSVTVLLLYLAGLMVHSFVRAATFDYGFDSKHVLLFTPPIPPLARGMDLTKYLGDRSNAVIDARMQEKTRRIAASLESLRRNPTVVAAASLWSVPLVTTGSRPSTSQPGRPRDNWLDVREFGGRHLIPPMPARGDTVSSEFVLALGARLVAGSAFDDPQYAGREDIVIVNRTLARQLAPIMNVTGTELYPGLLGTTIRTTWSKGRIIGVIDDLVYSTPGEAAVPQFFVPSLLSAPYGTVVVIRTAGDVETTSRAIRTALEQIWGDLPPKHFTLLRDAWHAGLVPFRGKALLFTLIAGFCVPLAAIGLMGALLYSVQVRARETAVRIALGAEPGTVRRSVVRRGLTIVGVGLLVGTALGMTAGRIVSHQLFNVQPADPWTMIGVTVALMALAWVAAFVPARRASEVDPGALLRSE